MTNGFVRWTLRTTDLEAARAFYAGLLEEGAPEIVELPEMARARGAKPHWLGHLAAAVLAKAVEDFVARGAVRLGGGELLREPNGAILAVTTPQQPARRDVVWQQLLVGDPARAARDYGELFGMKPGARMELAEHGSFDQFGWGSGDEPAGSIGDLTGKPHIHPQWLFFFRAADLDAAMRYVREKGGSVLGPTDLPDGRRVAVCDDPQGAAFGLMSGG